MYAWVNAPPDAPAPMPIEIEAGRRIDRYGAQAVYGRPLGYWEMHRISLAEAVERVCRKWREKDSARWFREHPADMKLLLLAKKAHDGYHSD